MAAAVVSERRDKKKETVTKRKQSLDKEEEKKTRVAKECAEDIQPGSTMAVKRSRTEEVEMKRFRSFFTSSTTLPARDKEEEDKSMRFRTFQMAAHMTLNGCVTKAQHERRERMVSVSGHVPTLHDIDAAMSGLSSSTPRSIHQVRREAFHSMKKQDDHKKLDKKKKPWVRASRRRKLFVQSCYNMEYPERYEYRYRKEFSVYLNGRQPPWKRVPDSQIYYDVDSDTEEETAGPLLPPPPDGLLDLHSFMEGANQEDPLFQPVTQEPHWHEFGIIYAAGGSASSSMSAQLSELARYVVIRHPSFRLQKPKTVVESKPSLASQA